MIRPARPDDVPTIASLIRELAAYEKLADQVTLDEASLREHLFGPRPAAEALLAESGGAVAGFALFFQNYSTFRGRPGMYLEDLYVRPQHRGEGLGKALFAAVAQLAVARGCPRMDWAVLTWNAPAIRFYESLGADRLEDWRLYRLTGDALAAAGANP